MIFFVLRRAMADGGITIKTAELSGSLGLTLFGARVILMDPHQSPAQWRCTLLHELIHMCRGPVSSENAAAEEDIVTHLASLLLMPDGQELADAQAWTDADMRALAEQRGVDVDTVMAALNPPTMPLRALVRPAFIPLSGLTSHLDEQHSITKESVALAARSRTDRPLPTVVGAPRSEPTER